MSDWTEVIPCAQIPVVIICHNLLGDLRNLVSWLETAGHEKLILLDNDSSYPPLLDYLRNTPHHVIYLRENLGHQAPWLSGLTNKFGDSPFVITDPDLLPEASCPLDAVEYFQTLLLRHRDFDQAGFGLRIDDLPELYPHREAVKQWERPFWSKEVESDVFAAHIDTTFAVYRPGTHYKVTEAVRTGAPRRAHHLPWYRDPNSPDEETAYFFAHRSPAFGYWNRTELLPQCGRTIP